jgi:hypothetical protein
MQANAPCQTSLGQYLVNQSCAKRHIVDRARVSTFLRLLWRGLVELRVLDHDCNN